MKTDAAADKRLAGADKLWHLEQAALVAGLPTHQTHLISRLSFDRIFEEGEIIFDQDEPAKAFYFLNRGSVRLAMKNGDGREKTLGILRTGDLFGLEAIGSSPKYRLQSVAHEECWVSYLLREQYLKLASENPTLYYNLIQILLRQLGEAHEDIKALCFMDIEQRLVHTLLKLSESHGRKLATYDNMVKLKVRISHDYLARLIGSNRPYLSNIMSHFKKQGWVHYHRKHLVIDTNALQQLA